MKYQGSKNRIAKELLEAIKLDNGFIDKEYWIEPFVGGANMIDKVDVSIKKIGYDNNKYLIEFFKQVQKGYNPPEYVDEETYKDIKLNKNNYPDYLVGFVGIGCSFAGKWFGGFARNISKSEKNSELLNKTSRNYCNESRRNILKQRSKIMDVKFLINDYRDIKIDFPKKTIIYCDPPYNGTTKYHTGFDHIDFWQWADEQVFNGCKVYVSEYEAPNHWHSIWEKEIISSLDKNTGGKKGIEKLFTR